MFTQSLIEKTDRVIRYLLKQTFEYKPALELLEELRSDSPTWYVVWGPDGLPILQRPCMSVGDAVSSAAKWVANFAHQGYYTDSNRRRLSLAELADCLRVEEFHAPTATYVAYSQYVENNMGRMDQDGWIPVCFDEFAESDECFEMLAKGARA